MARRGEASLCGAATCGDGMGVDREPTLHRVNWSMYIQRTENGRLGLARATRGSIFRTESRTHGARGAGKSGMHRQSTFCEMHATVAIIPQGREAGQQTEDLGPLMFPSVAALVLQTHGRSPAILYLYVLTILPVFPLTSPSSRCAFFFPNFKWGKPAVACWLCSVAQIASNIFCQSEKA